MKQFQLFLIVVVFGVTYALPVTKVEEKKEDNANEHPDDVEVIYKNFKY